MCVLVDEAVKAEPARSWGCPTVVYLLRVSAVRSNLGSILIVRIRGSELVYHGAIGIEEQE